MAARSRATAKRSARSAKSSYARRSASVRRELRADRGQNPGRGAAAAAAQPAGDANDEHHEQRACDDGDEPDVVHGDSDLVQEPAGAVPERRRRLGARDVAEHAAERRLADDPRGGDLVLPERVAERTGQTERNGRDTEKARYPPGALHDPGR